MNNKNLTWPIGVNNIDIKPKTKIPLGSIVGYNIDYCAYHDDIKEYMVGLTLEISVFDSADNSSKIIKLSDKMTVSQFTDATKITLDIDNVDGYIIVGEDTTNSILPIK